MASDLKGTGVGLLLTDARGQVVDRRVADTGILTRLDRIELAPGFLYSEDLIGTNAIGTAITQQGPSVVTGAEHFADALAAMASAATLVTDGAGQVIGVIDLTCAAEDFNPMLLPFEPRRDCAAATSPSDTLRSAPEATSHAAEASEHDSARLVGSGKAA